jgi:hypothetical protein
MYSLDDWPELLATAISHAGNSFCPGELAYLALTSKVERPLMDRLSYQLHRQFMEANQPVDVAREFSIRPSIRADLAILQRKTPTSAPTPIVAVEAKAMATFDCTREAGQRREYPDLLQRDLQRYECLGDSCPQVFCILFATHLRRPPAPELQHIVKYHSRLRRAFSADKTDADIRDIVDGNLAKYLVKPTRFDKIKAGEAFGIEVEVLWWLFAPVLGPSGMTILKQ